MYMYIYICPSVGPLSLTVTEEPRKENSSKTKDVKRRARQERKRRRATEKRKMKGALSERYSNDNADTLTSGMRMRVRV